MLLHYSFVVQLVIFCGVNCRLSGLSTKQLRKQLFTSRHVVTESDEFDGGVLVNEDGIIESVLRRNAVEIMLKSKNLKVVDGGNWALLAGGIDSDVHVNEPSQTSWEGYVSATQAAAAGGITTIIDVPLHSIPPTTSVENLLNKANIAKGEVYVDVGFWGGVVPDNGEQLRDMLKAGVVGFKCILMNSSFPQQPYVAADDLDKVFAHLNGTGSVLAFDAKAQLDSDVTDCEDHSCPDPNLYETYLESRPDEMELNAVSLITSHLNNTDVHVHIAHVSSAGVVPILEKARENMIKNGHNGWRGGITAETCSHYLTLSSDQIPPGHSEFKSVPPIRNNTNKQKLWEYIRDQRLDLVTSGHSPSVAEGKGENFLEAWGGVQSIQFDLSLFWTEAKPRGFKLSTLSHYWSAGPARLTGLQEKKGSIRKGLEADLIFFDPNASFIVTPENIRCKNKISPYMNRVLTGKVMQTYVRGQLVYAGGEFIGGPKGQLLLKDARSHGVFIFIGFRKSVLFSLIISSIITLS